MAHEILNARIDTVTMSRLREQAKLEERSVSSLVAILLKRAFDEPLEPTAAEAPKPIGPTTRTGGAAAARRSPPTVTTEEKRIRATVLGKARQAEASAAAPPAAKAASKPKSQLLGRREVESRLKPDKVR